MSATQEIGGLANSLKTFIRNFILFLILFFLALSAGWVRITCDPHEFQKDVQNTIKSTLDSNREG